MRRVSSRPWPARRVLALVGHDPFNRDPSYVSPHPQRDPRPAALIAIAVALSAIILLLSYMAVR
jgi:hypothetical protein